MNGGAAPAALLNVPVILHVVSVNIYLVQA